MDKMDKNNTEKSDGRYKLCVSIPKVYKKFLDDNPYLSPSKILQARISQIMVEDSKKSVKEDILLKRLAKFHQIIRDTGNFLEKKGIYEEYKKNVLEKEDISE